MTVLAIYWVLAFVATHVPPLWADGPRPAWEPPVGKDKLFHFAGFAALSFLLMNALGRRVVLTLGVCLLYGLLDEATQPPFGRTADPYDLLADLLGAAAGIVAWRLTLRRWTTRPSNCPSN